MRPDPRDLKGELPAVPAGDVRGVHHRSSQTS